MIADLIRELGVFVNAQPRYKVFTDGETIRLVNGDSQECKPSESLGNLCLDLDERLERRPYIIGSEPIDYSKHTIRYCGNVIVVVRNSTHSGVVGIEQYPDYIRFLASIKDKLTDLVARGQDYALRGLDPTTNATWFTVEGVVYPKFAESEYESAQVHFPGHVEILCSRSRAPMLM
jgi:hypothetical protein